MPPVHAVIFSSNRKFEVYTNICPLVPSLVLVGWYIKTTHLKSGLSNIQSSEDAKAIEATQELGYKRSGAGISASAGAGLGPEIERIHRHGMDIINSTADGNSEMEVPAPAPKRPHSTRSGRTLPLHGEDADPGTKRRPTSWSEVNIPHKSPLKPSYAPSDSGGGPSVTSSSSSSSSSPSSSKPFHPGSYFKPKARLDLNVAGRDIHVLHVPGRILQASFDDGYGMEYKVKIRKTKEPTGATPSPSVANPASN